MEDEKTMPTELITPEMREAGVDETTPLKTREEVAAEIGEENMPSEETVEETEDVATEASEVEEEA